MPNPVLPSSEKDAITPPLSPFSPDFPQSRWRSGRPLGRCGRALLVLWGLFLLAGFCLAASVEPDPRGFGTHQRFGLSPCTFIQLFDIPCPSCGMTTCFAHFVRGEWPSAARANSAGLLLALVCAVQIPWCWASAWQGRYWMLDEPDMALFWMTIALAGATLLQWIVRLALRW